MMERPFREITQDEITTFHKDGIVFLKGFFNMDWVEKLREQAEIDLASPGRLHQELTQGESGGRFFFDTFLWTFNDGFKEFVMSSPAAEMAGQMMRAEKINVFFDQLLIKEPGTAERTPWHQDLPYWPVDGEQVCTLWLALDPVDAETGAVEYVKGSHLWGQGYKPPAFAGDDKYKLALPPVPDIEAQRDELDIAQFEFDPGDCTIHHGKLVHGAPGNARSDLRRRAYVTRWAGDDAIYTPDPEKQEMMWDPEIEAGDPLDSDLWPVVWQRS
jgi:ectoine hydroxylase-related dioxygenase (phytanoyl-CoA dioxygenase family)